MEAVARSIAKNIPLSPQKGRMVADLIRGKQVGQAIEILQFSTKKGGYIIRKALDSAIANAEEKNQIDIDNLFIFRIEVSDGINMKRVRFGARGRVNRITKRRCRILLELSERKITRGRKGKR